MMPTMTLAAGAGPGALAIDLLLILACAGFVALVFGRLRVAVIPGYLVAGAIIGPHALGLVGGDETIEGIASLATVLLMFGIGMHLDVSVLRHGAALIVTAGLVTTLVSAALITFAVRAMGLGWGESAAIGMAMSLSSTAVVLRILQQRRELFTAAGRVSLGVLLMQDMLVIAMLASIPLLARAQGGGGEDGAGLMDAENLVPMIQKAALSVGVVLGIVLAGKVLLPRLMVEASRSPSPEIMLVIAAASALGAAVATAGVGLSPELGAFMAGFLLAGTPFRYQLAGQITPLRDLFMAVFFTTVGLKVSIPELADAWWVVGLATLGVVVLKAVVIGGVSWGLGASPMIAGRAGIWLAQGGEFSLVLLSVASAAGVLSPSAEARTIGVVACTLVITPALITQGVVIARAMSHLPMAPWGARTGLRETPALSDAEHEGEEGAPTPESPGSDKPRVLIAGFGPVGWACAERLEQSGAEITVIELNAKTVRMQLDLGRHAYYGDITNHDVLEHAGIYSASAVVLTMPDEEAMMRAIRMIRSLRPDIFIAARSGVVTKAAQARELGADEVVVEELASAEVMAKRVLGRLRTLHASIAADDEPEQDAGYSGA